VLPSSGPCGAHTSGPRNEGNGCLHRPRTFNVALQVFTSSSVQQQEPEQSPALSLAVTSTLAPPALMPSLISRAPTRSLQARWSLRASYHARRGVKGHRFRRRHLGTERLLFPTEVRRELALVGEGNVVRLSRTLWDTDKLDYTRVSPQRVSPHTYESTECESTEHQVQGGTGRVDGSGSQLSSPGFSQEHEPSSPDAMTQS
jgi:hypothetical protein